MDGSPRTPRHSRLWLAGLAAIALGTALPTHAADPAAEAEPTCAEGSTLVWTPTYEVDPRRKKACQA